MFPFKTLCSLRSFLRLIPTTREIDLMPGIGTAAGELGFMSHKDLDHELLGVVEGIDGGVLGESGKHGYEHEYDAARYNEHGSGTRTW